MIQASSKIDKKVLEHISSSNKPFMQYPGEEEYIDAYHRFYDQFMEKKELSLTE